jgi:ABC-type glycerol-3-phosphate transport system permease component
MSTEPTLTSATAVESRSQPDYRFMSYRWQNILNRFLGYLILITLTLLSAAPLLWMVMTSLRDRREVLGGSLIPSTLTFSAYQFILSEYHIMIFFWNSIIVTLATIIIVVSLATLAGYAFARIDFWGRHIIFLTLLSTLMVPSTVLIIPLFLQLRDFRLIDTQLGLILAYVGGGLAFSMFLMRSFFEALPSELVDAGRIDGAGEFGIFWRIMLPLAKPGIATITIFQFMGAWNEFIFAATFVHTPELRTLQPSIFAMVGRYSTNWPGVTAALTLSILPIIIVYVFMQRQFVAGLTSGAIKG